jgi:hypothetical protein
VSIYDFAAFLQLIWFTSVRPEAKPCSQDVASKLKCPLFLAHDMSGYKVNQRQSGLWESGNPAGFAGFPSEVGKSAL